MFKSNLVLSALIASSISYTSQAELLLTFTQVNANVVVSASGEVDLAGLGSPRPFGLVRNPGTGEIRGEAVFGRVWSGIVLNDDSYNFNTTYTLFSEEFPERTGLSTGDDFGLFANGQTATIYFSDGFTNGPISGELVLNNTQLDDLGLNTGGFSWGPGENQRISIVPEPASLAIIGLGGFALARRRRSC